MINKMNSLQRSMGKHCPRIRGLKSKGNFLKKSLHYKLYLPSLNTEIFRKYSDFVWLYNKLVLKYGNQIKSGLVPILPNKMSLKGMNKQLISDHCKVMQQFICGVFKNARLFHDETMVYFLSLSYDKIKSLSVNKKTKYVSTTYALTQTVNGSPAPISPDSIQRF
eukprot:124833_1